MILSTAGETILVVDDHGALRGMMELILSSAGYRVLTAESGLDALLIARDAPRIDLLVSDLEMPHMRGDELATRFARLHPLVPILFASSSDRAINTTQPFDFLAKPFTVAELCDSVRRALRARPVIAETSDIA